MKLWFWSALLLCTSTWGFAQPKNIRSNATNTSRPASTSALNLYENARFGYKISYPRTLIPQTESENGDGRMFRSEDEQTTLLVWGRLPLRLAGDLEDAYNLAKENRRVTYQLKRSSWFVVSGFTQDNKVFYSKTVLVSDHSGTYLKTFEMLYPVAQKARWDAVTTKIAQSFN